MMKDIKLVLVLKYDQKGLKYDYEAEFRRCIAEWRKNAGWLKDIEILIYSDIELDNLPENVTWKYYDFMDDGQMFSHNYAACHQAGRMAELDYPESTLLHIDMDMCILKPLPEELFNHDTVIGVYGSLDNPRDKIIGDYFAESDFIITSPKSTFYSDFFKVAKLVMRTYNICPCNYWAEEYVCDYLLATKKYHIFEDYEYGQGFDTVPNSPYFLHVHIPLIGQNNEKSIIL